MYETYKDIWNGLTNICITILGMKLKHGMCKVYKVKNKIKQINIYYIMKHRQSKWWIDAIKKSIFDTEKDRD